MRRKMQDEQQSALPKKTTLPYYNMFIYASIMAVFVYNIYIVKFFTQGAVGLVHELGHMLTAWILGYPAVVVFSSGGFFSQHFHRPIWLMLILFTFYGYFVYQWIRKNKKIGLWGIIGSIFFVLIFFKPTLSQASIGFMGIGGEIVGAFAFCYAALNQHRSIFLVMRYVYLSIGVILYTGVYVFIYKLCVDSSYLSDYLNRSDGMVNDFAKIQDMLDISISSQALFSGCIATLSIYILWQTSRLPYDHFASLWVKIKDVVRFKNSA